MHNVSDVVHGTKLHVMGTLSYSNTVKKKNKY